MIHGSQAQLEMPRDRLKPNKSINRSASCVGTFKNRPVSGTIAMPPINITRIPQPPNTKFLYPIRFTCCAAGIWKITSSGIIPAMIPSTVALAWRVLA